MPEYSSQSNGMSSDFEVVGRARWLLRYFGDFAFSNKLASAADRIVPSEVGVA
jgi:hypothetical protein